jgi:hypothetical protein
MAWFDVLPGEQIAYRVHGKDVNNEYSVFDLRMAPNKGNGPIAIHHKADEIFRILESEARFHINSENNRSYLWTGCFRLQPLSEGASRSHSARRHSGESDLVTLKSERRFIIPPPARGAVAPTVVGTRTAADIEPCFGKPRVDGGGIFKERVRMMLKNAKHFIPDA